MVELESGMGLYMILVHQLGAMSTVMMDGDMDALKNMRKNVDYNIR